jgi:hypothetical protein
MPHCDSSQSVQVEQLERRLLLLQPLQKHAKLKDLVLLLDQLLGVNNGSILY